MNPQESYQPDGKRCPEPKIKDSRDRHAMVLSRMAEGIMIFAGDGRLLDMNLAALTMHGYDSASEIPDSLAELQQAFEICDLDGNVLPVEEWPFARVLRGETFSRCEVRVRRTEGDRQWVASYGGAHVQDAEGRIQLAIITLRDVTEQTQMEQALRKNRQLLQIANASLEQRVADQTAEVRRRTFQLQTLATQLSQAEQRERRRLARVLHDHLQQLLVGAKINLRVAMRQFAGEPLRQAMEEVVNLLDESIRASRSLSVELSPPVLYKGSFAAAIRWLAERISEKHFLKVEIEAEEQVNPAADEIRVLLFETVQELLFNVVKHANTDHAFVRIQHGQ
jgi:PAS domain S-box-containing protein